MKSSQILFSLLVLVAVSYNSLSVDAATATGYEYDAEYSGGKMTCVNTTHFDMYGTPTGYSVSCQKDKELVKLVERYACFPRDAMIEFENGTAITMDQLRVGDYVKTDDNSYEQVIGWLHYEPEKYMSTVCLNAYLGSDKYEVCASADHFIPVQGKLVRFGDVIEGNLLSNAESDDNLVVVDTYQRFSKGVFAPATSSGKLIVNGVLVSTYAYISPNDKLRTVLNQVLVDVPFEKCSIEGVHCVAYLAMRVLDFLQTVINSFMSVLFVR